MTEKRFACPCCGALTLAEAPPGTFAVCPVCYWEDDDVQFRDPSFTGGANPVSLHVARTNYTRFGAIAEKFRDVVRRPTNDEIARR